MSKHLISVIVPVYNVEDYVEACINSLLNQTYNNIEIIIVNDGSTDKSLEICNQFNDTRIKVIDKENRGLSSARREGISKAKGDYFCTIDSDDYVDAFYIEKLYRAIIDTNSDIAICNRYDFSGSSVLKIVKSNSSSVTILNKKEITHNYFKYASKYNMSDSWDKMYKKSFVDSTNVKFYLPREFNGTDLLFNYLILLYCPKVVTIPDALLYHRTDNYSSQVHRKDKKLSKGFRFIFDEIVHETEKLNYGNQINNNLSELYFSLQFYASYDLYLSKNKSKTEKYINYLDENINYITQNKSIFDTKLRTNYKYIKNTQSAILKGSIYLINMNCFLYELKSKLKIITLNRG